MIETAINIEESAQTRNHMNLIEIAGSLKYWRETPQLISDLVVWSSNYIPAAAMRIF